MVQTLQIVTIVIVSIAMALGVAHALELPGKLRLLRILLVPYLIVHAAKVVQQ
jgi:hypothetical protein